MAACLPACLTDRLTDRGSILGVVEAPSCTPVVVCCDSSTCPLATCLLYCARRALHTSPVKPELCLQLQPHALPCPLGYFYSSSGYFSQTHTTACWTAAECISICMYVCVSGQTVHLNMSRAVLSSTHLLTLDD